MSPLTISNLRSLLKIGGTYLAAAGISNETQIDNAIGGILAIAGILMSYLEHRRGSTQPPATPVVLLLLSTAVLVSTGCARFTTNQSEHRYADGKPTTTIQTKVSAVTLFTAKSQLANFKATQTEKTQGASVGSLVNETSGTNAVQVLQALSALVGALPK